MDNNDSPTVTVAPITHTPPNNPTVTIEIPQKVKQHLGLDSERSWVILDEFNEFVWAGYDLRFVPGKIGKYDYGFLPPSFFNQITKKILEIHKKGLKKNFRD